MRILYLPNEYSQQRQREKKRKIYPVLMAAEAEWYRQQGHIVQWNMGKGIRDGGWSDYLAPFYDKIITEPENLPFLSLPHPDREFTRWWEYQDNGNFKYRPGTYIQAANGCWHGKCTFCVEKGKPYEIRPVEDVIEEIKKCQKMEFKEVFDDSGSFPIGVWLDRFIGRFRNEFAMACRISCNCRLGNLPFADMYSAGFRMLLFGLESANQGTLDRINKGVKVEDYKYIIKAAKAGLEPHIAVMFGYPWETDSDAIRTLRLVWWLLKKGYAKTAQASVYNPCQTTEDSPERRRARKYVVRIYEAAYSPVFWFNKIKDIKNVDDLKYLWRCIKAGLNG